MRWCWSQSAICSIYAYEVGFSRDEGAGGVLTSSTNNSVQLCLHSYWIRPNGIFLPGLWGVACVYVCVRAWIWLIPALWRAHSEWKLCGLTIKANWTLTLYHQTETKPLKVTGRSVFMWCLWARWTITQQQICLFFLSPKASSTKSLWVLLHLTQWKAYVLPSCLYSASKMDCGWGLRKHPCPLESATMPSNKISCHGSSLFGSPSSPPPTLLSLQTCYSDVSDTFF